MVVLLEKNDVRIELASRITPCLEWLWWRSRAYGFRDEEYLRLKTPHVHAPKALK